ncbi:MAG: hypothetical protein NT165_03640 [Candidatus Falkowbacteria bacterium]|nr:hypothetical protein [Candidatus Falkowbacteria bacterium]
MDNRQNLMRYAEESAYSSKGHFRTADWIKSSLKLYIGLPIILSILIIIFPDMPIWLSRILSFLSIGSSIMALLSPAVSNQDSAFKNVNDHMSLGNEYLGLYKDIRNISTSNTISDDQIQEVVQRIKLLDEKTNFLHISFAGRIWSKLRINKEMDLDWIKK